MSSGKTYAEYVAETKNRKPSPYLMPKECALPSKMRARKQPMQRPPLDIAPKRKAKVTA